MNQSNYFTLSDDDVKAVEKLVGGKWRLTKDRTMLAPWGEVTPEQDAKVQAYLLEKYHGIKSAKVPPSPQPKR